MFEKIPKRLRQLIVGALVAIAGYFGYVFFVGEDGSITISPEPEQVDTVRIEEPVIDTLADSTGSGTGFNFIQ